MKTTKTRLAKESYLDDEYVGLSYTHTFRVHNKMDLPGAEERIALLKEFCPLDFREFRISAEHGSGLEDLRSADYDKPFTLKRGGTLLEVAEIVHRDMAANFKYARVWGSAVLAPGTQMKGDYIVHDKDVVEIHA